MNSAIYSKITCFLCDFSFYLAPTVRPSDIARCAEGRWGTSRICSEVEEKITDVTLLLHLSSHNPTTFKVQRTNVFKLKWTLLVVFNYWDSLLLLIWLMSQRYVLIIFLKRLLFLLDIHLTRWRHDHPRRKDNHILWGFQYKVPWRGKLYHLLFSL